jgi:hypothetical protein
MTQPLTLSFEVACSPDHAFDVWTSGIGTWWPRDHTASGQAAVVVLQSGVGGRIYERADDGIEHDWGEVTVWDPPARLVYLWHIGHDRSDATEVEIHFVARDRATTRIEIEHRGWERLGALGAERRNQNLSGWEALLPAFQAAVTKEDDR